MNGTTSDRRWHRLMRGLVDWVGGVWRSGWAGRCLLLACGAMVPGLLLPVVAVDTVASRPAAYSIVEGIWRLLTQGKLMLGLLIGVFSVVFPIFKLALLLRTCRGSALPVSGRLFLLLGKWSMLDVFVVAVLLGAGRMRLLSSVESAPGIYWFGLAVVLSLVAAELLLADRAIRPAPPRARSWRERAGAVLPLVTLAVLAAGLTLPLMDVSKWWFWENEYSLLTALPQLWLQKEWLLPGVLAVAVVAAPLTALVAALGYHWSDSPQLLKIYRQASQVSMLSVFVLSLLLVIAKLSGTASVAPRGGLWLLTLASGLSLVNAWWLERTVTRRLSAPSLQPEPQH